MLLSLVVPCFNERECIRETNRRLLDLAQRWLQEERINDYEIIYVNDGSTDDTLTILRELAANEPRVRIIAFANNFGHQAAILAGMHQARGDATVTLDADLQDPPETISEMLDRVRDGFQIVYGVRRARDKDTAFKRTTAHAFYHFMRWMRVPVIFDHSDFRLITRPVSQTLRAYPERTLFLRGLFPLMGFRHCTVAYDRPERFAGETKYPFRKMMSFAINGITSFTYTPLRFAFFLGSALALVSLALAIWAFVVWLTDDTVQGWTSIVIPLYFFMGIQMMLLGIMGEYIGKIFQELKQRPRYVIGETINMDTDPSTFADNPR